MDLILITAFSKDHILRVSKVLTNSIVQTNGDEEVLLGNGRIRKRQS